MAEMTEVLKEMASTARPGIAVTRMRDYKVCRMCGGFGLREYSCVGSSECDITAPHFHSEPCPECPDAT